MNRLAKTFSSVFLLTFLFPSAANAQVVINEVFPDPEGEEDGAEWVELYNSTAGPYSLNGCTIYLDDTSASQKIIFDIEDFIDVFKVISWDGTWLNNSGDQVILDCVSFKDQVNYGNVSNSVVDNPTPGYSIGRSPDGTGSFYKLSSVTLGLPNSAPPTPTPLPPPTATVTPTPRPTSTLFPTSVPTPTPTKIRPSPTPKDAEEDEENEDTGVLGVREESTPASTLDEEEDGESKSIPKTPLFLIGGGALFLCSSIATLYIKRKKVS